VIDTTGVAAVWKALPEARMIGGAVRDWLLGRACADVDFAVPLEPWVTMSRVRAAGLKAVPTGLAHGTVTVIAGEQAFEVTTLRRDVETNGRHAVVAFTDDWEVDASRRDFTINAMSVDQDGKVFDYFDGRRDLADGRVRFVGAPAARISEDFLRILRFFRFFARYGRGAPDTAAVAAIHKLREGVLTLSAERVWSEIKSILMAQDPRSALALMQQTGVLTLLLEDADLERLNALVVRGAPVDALLRVAALLRGDALSYAHRWKLSGAEAARLAALVSPNTLSIGADEAQLRRALAEETHETLIGRGWLAADGDPGWAALQKRLMAMESPVFPLHGRDVTELGVAPGPKVGEVLRNVYEWWKAGGCVEDAVACREQAARKISQTG
jgi:poly(A) polymerase/tRNA nucleotidyltransferase (CCA-adding enzyme)